MTLTSLTFFAFVLAVLIVYYLIPKRLRWLVLLAASLVFYGLLALKSLPFILFTALSTWAGALWLGQVTRKRTQIWNEQKSGWDPAARKAYKKQTQKMKRRILALILVLNFGILAVLKYYDFVVEQINRNAGGHLSFLGILLPLGISFYTFQSMGYLIDIYGEKMPPESNPLRYLLYVTFFPQIIQGPIADYQKLAPQLYEGQDLRYENLKYGFQLILWGLFKKMVIADRLAVSLQSLLPVKDEISNAWQLLILLIYCAQLYCDFSGGIDVVRGVGGMLGIEMAVNFKRPFFSKGLAEFWQRWHISLCAWLRTYLLYPIAVSKPFLRFGNRIIEKSRSEQELPEDSLWGGFTFIQHLGRVLPGAIATLITFLIIGIWHGASWQYAGYGVWNGVILFFSMLLAPVFQWLIRRLHIQTESTGWKVWQILRTAVIVGLSFTFDIADGLMDALRMIGKCFTPVLGPTTHLGTAVDTGLAGADWGVVIAGLLIVFAVSLYQELTGRKVRESLNADSAWVSWVLTLGCLIAVVIFGMYGPGVASGEFVYMQF
ncbi:MAG: MBOAT family protein [Parasporobacterium sp.]|nr:MBOAT family protein [Parasporobacterium sp.]